MRLHVTLCAGAYECTRLTESSGVKASSRHIPGVEFCGRPHPGVIGTAPSKELLAVWESRERGINERYVNHGHICAIEPSSSGAFVGQDLPQDLMDNIKNEGARTKPAREVSDRWVCYVCVLLPWSEPSPARGKHRLGEPDEGFSDLPGGSLSPRSGFQDLTHNSASLCTRRQPLGGRPALLAGRWRAYLCTGDGR